LEGKKNTCVPPTSSASATKCKELIFPSRTSLMLRASPKANRFAIARKHPIPPSFPFARFHFTAENIMDTTNRREPQHFARKDATMEVSEDDDQEDDADFDTIPDKMTPLPLISTPPNTEDVKKMN